MPADLAGTDAPTADPGPALEDVGGVGPELAMADVSNSGPDPAFLDDAPVEPPDLNGDPGVSAPDNGGVDPGGGQDAGPIEPGGPVPLIGAMNVRETGGLPAAGGLHVKHRVLIRSGGLATLDADGCQQFATLGIRSIVDLRTSAEAEAKPDAACATANAAYHLAGLPKILPPTPESYVQTLDAARAAFPGIFARLAAPDGLPAILHCVIGRDRASIAMAVVLLSLGVPGPDVVEDFVVNQEAVVQAEWMQAALDRIAEAGGIEAFLNSCGVDPAHVATLKKAALE